MYGYSLLAFKAPILCSKTIIKYPLVQQGLCCSVYKTFGRCEPGSAIVTMRIKTESV